MNYRRFGGVGWGVSEIRFGGWASALIGEMSASETRWMRWMLPVFWRNAPSRPTWQPRPGGGVTTQ